MSKWADVRSTVETNRESLTKAVDATHSAVQLPVFQDDRAVDADELGRESAYEVVLLRRRYVMPAPWAIREYYYVANVFVLSSRPDEPLVYGEWKPQYRYPDGLDHEIPLPENP